MSGLARKRPFWLLDIVSAYAERSAVWWRGSATTYGALAAGAERWRVRLADLGIAAGESVAIVGDYCPESISLLLALADLGCVVVPLSPGAVARHPELFDIACVRWAVVFDASGEGRSERVGEGGEHPLLAELAAREEPGIVIFTSGSTGSPRGAVHSLDHLVDRGAGGRPWVTLVFLLWDHIGGQNTLMRLLAAGGEIVLVDERDPESVCRAIERHRVQLLPTSPTFLRMLLVSGALDHRALPSLELVTYGTEPMPESTLRLLREALPHVRLKQTYGLSELGILQTRSEGSDSLWIEPGPELEHKVVDGVLWLKVRSAMLGYLNAPSPFLEDGWYDTGDLVEVRGPYLRLLGRRSERINVGGEKVHPAEVESVLLEMEGVEEATVRGANNPLTGQIVEATLVMREAPEPRALLRAVREHCRGRLAPHAIPARVRLCSTPVHGERFKKVRDPSESGEQP